MLKSTIVPLWKHSIVVLMTMLFGALAQAQAPAPEGDDPPVRVGRLSYISGQVSFSPSGNEEWVQARINRPIVTGDQLWADNDSRAELTIDNSTWWLGQQTSVAVSNLDDRVAQFQVQQGTLDFRVRRIPSGNIIEVDTPNLAFSVTRPGRYRVTVDPQDGATTVIVREGAADVYGENASYAIASGQAYRFYGNDLSDSEIISQPRPDALDRFVVERDRRYTTVVSARYVSPEVVGYEDLDTYGTWSVVGTYGNVWFPRGVHSGWAPYREGHWVWIDPWGWTWVDDEPWGFAPFHYGRWAYFDQGWGWIPGPRAVRPVYAPALVAFVGGAGFSIAVSAGPAIGWFPLGPREVYRPPYAVSRNYFQQVNVSNTVINQTTVVNVYNNYRQNVNVSQVNYVNMRAPNAVTAVPPTVFAQSQNVGRAAVALPASAITRAEVQSVARVAPARTAFVGAAPAAQARPPAAVTQRAVVAKVAPPPPPVPDAQKLQALERNPGQPLTRRELQQMRQTTQAQQPARPVRVVEQPKPAATAAPPARPAGEGGPRRAAGAAGAPSGGAPGTPSGAPGAAVAPPGQAGAPPGQPRVATPPQERERAGAAPAGPRGPAGTPPAAQERQPSSASPAEPRGPAGGPPGQERERPGAAPAGPRGPAGTPPAAQERQPSSAPSGEPRGPAGGPPGQQRERPGASPAGPRGPAGAPPGQERGAERPTPESPAARPPQARQPEPRSQPETRQLERREPPQARPPEARPQPEARQPERREPPQARPPEARPQPEARQLERREPPQARPEPRPQPQQQPQARPEPRPQPQAQPQPRPEPRPQPPQQPQARPEPRPQPQAQPQPRPQPQPEAQQPQGNQGGGRGQPERPQGRERGKDKDKDKENG